MKSFKLRSQEILKISLIFIAALIWPINFLKNNADWPVYTVAVAAALFAVIFVDRSKKLGFFLWMLTGLTIPTMALVNTTFFFAYGIAKKNKIVLLLGLISAMILMVNADRLKENWVLSFKGNEIQQIDINRSIYKNRLAGLVWHNKATSATGKTLNNFFLETDLNNYFFALHPREIVIDNQNLQKYPAFLVFFALIGLFCIFRKAKPLALTLGILSLISLSLLNNPDKYDFIMYPFVLALLVVGINHVKLPRLLLNIVLTGFIALSLIELLRAVIL